MNGTELTNVYMATVTDHLTGTHLWIFYYITSLAIFDESKSNVYFRIRKWHTLVFLIIANKYCEVHKPVLTESVLFSNRTNINAKAGFIHKHTVWNITFYLTSYMRSHNEYMYMFFK